MTRSLRHSAAITLLAIAIACAVSVSVRAEQIVVEAEDYLSYYDFAYTLISPLNVGLTVVLQGLDMSGEWTEYTLPVTAYGSYSFSMVCFGDLNMPYVFNVYFIPKSGGTQQMITVSFTGKGCFT